MIVLVFLIVWWARHPQHANPDQMRCRLMSTNVVCDNLNTCFVHYCNDNQKKTFKNSNLRLLESQWQLKPVFFQSGKTIFEES